MLLVAALLFVVLVLVLMLMLVLCFHHSERYDH